MRLIMAFLSFTFTIMFIMFAFELARFLKNQLQNLVRYLLRRRKKKVSFKDVEAIVNSEVMKDDNNGEVFGDIQVSERDSKC